MFDVDNDSVGAGGVSGFFEPCTICRKAEVQATLISNVYEAMCAAQGGGSSAFRDLLSD